MLAGSQLQIWIYLVFLLILRSVADECPTVDTLYLLIRNISIGRYCPGGYWFKSTIFKFVTKSMTASNHFYFRGLFFADFHGTCVSVEPPSQNNFQWKCTGLGDLVTGHTLGHMQVWPCDLWTLQISGYVLNLRSYSDPCHDVAMWPVDRLNTQTKVMILIVWWNVTIWPVDRLHIRWVSWY